MQRNLRMICSCKTLKVFNIDGNKLDDECIYRLIEIIKRNNDIAELYAFQEFTLNVTQKLCDFIINNKSLRKVNFNVDLSSSNVIVNVIYLDKQIRRSINDEHNHNRMGISEE